MLTLLFILLACTTEKSPAEKDSNRHWQKCASKSSGSQPECWDEKDWEIFCQRVWCLPYENHDEQKSGNYHGH